MQHTKKLIYIIMLICFGITLRSTNVYAYVESISGTNKVIKNNEVNSREYLLVCSYAHQSALASSVHSNGLWQRINIYYTYNDEWVVAWDNISSSEGYTKKGTAEKVFSTKSNVFISDADKQAIVQEGKCPELGYVDNSAINGGNEVCFGTQEYCKEKSKSLGAKEFAKGNTSSTKNYDILEDMDTFSTRWAPTDDWEWYKGLWGKAGLTSALALATINKDKATKQCEKFETEIKDSAGNLVRESIIKNFFNSDETDNVPAFLEPKAQSIISTLNGQLINYSIYVCDAITNNDSTLTEEEKEQKKKKQEEARKQIESDFESVKKELSSKVEGGSSMEITTGNINCEGIFDSAFGEVLKKAFTLIKFATPLLIIGLSIADFVKAILAQDNSEIKKAANKMVKRLIIGVLIFLLPTLLDLIFDLTEIESSTCGIR